MSTPQTTVNKRDTAVASDLCDAGPVVTGLLEALAQAAISAWHRLEFRRPRSAPTVGVHLMAKGSRIFELPLFTPVKPRTAEGQMAQGQ